MGNIISELRRRKKFSKKALAHDLNVDAGTIDKWENGANIRMENVVALAEYFGVSTDDILGTRKH
ncbi:helix-turn-helix transcriptional regulator [Streptococcus salivarius]|uniref:helix-turn-helix domain-containing protein n=1 Tax=Streptococcus salivarius TaxID=1304 RepID=UPI001912F3C8|nr:helix-turn-helix transcriptional regulator [Streptococcus salivarius]MBK5129587.1 helix-turn-helix transcriptional regulator [Streptococcus salivarius]